MVNFRVDFRKKCGINRTFAKINPTTNDLNTQSLMVDVFSFCRKIRMKEFFYKDKI